MRRFLLLTTALLGGLFIIGCQKDATQPSDNQLQLDAVVAEQAAFGWQANRMVLGANEVEGLTQNSQYLEEEGIDNVSSYSKLKKRALSMQRQVAERLKEMPALTKPTGDSLLYYHDDTVRGIRQALFYDFETGIARFYEVKYKFAAWRNIQYDSAQVVADLNLTLDDPADDLLENLYQLQEFKSDFFLQKIESQAVITDYDGTDITGAELTSDAWYHPNRRLQHLRQFVDMNPDNTGTLREDFDFRDGSSAYRSVTFNSDYTGSFEKQLRDGTTVQGTFDSVEDDLHGAYWELTDFPNGRYVDKIEKSAEVEITLPDSIFNADYSEIITFASGDIDSSSVSMQVQETDSVKITTMELHKRNGAFGTFVVRETDELSILEGNWTTWDGYYILLNAEYFIDGSAHVHYEVYASEDAYNNGDTPLIITDYYLSPDQSGKGTLSYENETYDVDIDASGKATISKQGKSTSVNLF